MTEPKEKPNYIPGLDFIGRGVYIRPHQPYELKQVLFERNDYRTWHSRETKKNYHVPRGYEVNDSPPMPAGQSLNQVLIEESWERFDKRFGLDTNLAVGMLPFNIDIFSTEKKQLRLEEEAYYAARSSFVPLWTVYLEGTGGFDEKKFDLDVPAPFDHSHRRLYDMFFERYGTHYIKRAWVGGKAMLAYNIEKTGKITKEEIQAGIKGSYGMLTGVEGELKQSRDRSMEKLANSSTCTVFGKGGSELKLARLNKMDQASYNEWLETIRENPKTIEMEVAGIWTLVRDEKVSQALMDAYRASSAFRSVTAVFSLDGKIYFVRGNKYFHYDIEGGSSSKPRPIEKEWPALLEHGFKRIDSAFREDNIYTHNGEKLDRKLFFFRRDRYLRLDVDKGVVDEGYPKKISEGWPGLAFDRIDAALCAGNDSTYFFRGNQYARFNFLENRVDEGYPEPTGKRWVGLTFDRIDAAIYWGRGKAYFFREDQHIRYDMVNYRSDPGYPKYIIGEYVEDWKFFD